MPLADTEADHRHTEPCAHAFRVHARGHRLGLQRQLGGEEAVLLAHRGLGPVQHVVDQPRAVGQRLGAAVDVLRAFAIDEEEVVAAGPAGDVDVLAQLDVALGAEDRQPPVAPHAQALRREPVDADVAGAAVAAQQHFAEVFELRRVRVGVVGDVRGHDLGARRAGEVQELVALVRGDVAQDAAVALALEEPVRPRVVAQRVRAEAHGLHDAADRAFGDEATRLFGGAVLEALGEADREDAPGLGLHALHLGEFVEADDSRVCRPSRPCRGASPRWRWRRGCRGWSR